MNNIYALVSHYVREKDCELCMIFIEISILETCR
jgi:hypothetical protein